SSEKITSRVVTILRISSIVRLAEIGVGSFYRHDSVGGLDDTVIAMVVAVCAQVLRILRGLVGIQDRRIAFLGVEGLQPSQDNGDLVFRRRDELAALDL